MGKTKGPYKEEFSVGTLIRIRNHRELEVFQAEWKYHHPIQNAQLSFAGMEAIVENVSFYHGGGELYSLNGIRGLWHEACLEAYEGKIR